MNKYLFPASRGKTKTKHQNLYIFTTLTDRQRFCGDLYKANEYQGIHAVI